MAKKKGIKVDFTGVEAGGGGRLLPEERFQFEVEEAEVEGPGASGHQYIALTLSVVDGEYKGTKAWDNLSLSPNALWKLRGFMEAAGLETVDGEMDINPDDFIGLAVMGDIIHEDYKGKPKHRINGYASVEEADAKESSASSGGPKKKKPAPAEEDTPEWKKGQEVSFKDGKKTLTGRITAISEDDPPVVTVKVGRDEYEMGPDDLEAA